MRPRATLAVLSLLAICTLADAAEPTIAMEWNTAVPEKEGAVWLAYLMARTNYVAENEASYEFTAGPLVPAFEEELAARSTVAQIYRELKDADPELGVPYFDDLVRVADGGFMREYLWTYLRQESWSEPDGLRLTEFNEWRRSHLAAHEVQTRGRLVVKYED